MISLNINVNKIDKVRLFQGKQGQYLDCVLIETPNSEYGDYMIVQSISKEERESGMKGTILGNAKIIVKKVYNEPAPQPNDFDKAVEPGNPDYKGDGIDKLPF